MIDLVTGLDKAALLITSVYLSLYLFTKNKLIFILCAQILILSNWSLIIPDSYSTVMVYDCLCVLLSGLVLSLLRSNPILFISQLFFFIFSSIAYAVDALYYYFQSDQMYELSISVFEIYPYVFWPYLALNVIGILKGKNNDGRHIDNNDTSFRDSNVYNDSISNGNMGYHEKRN